MRILVLTSSYPTSLETVASAFLQDWVKALALRRHELTVVAPCDRQDQSHVQHADRSAVSYFQYLPWPTFQTLAYGGGMFDNVRRNPLRLVQVVPFLYAQYEEARRRARHADLLHAHWLFPAGLVGAAVSREIGIPLVISVHSTDFHLLRSLPGGRALAWWIVRQADRLHFVTEHHRGAFASWLSGDVARGPESYVVPMGIPDALAEKPPSPLAQHPRIGFMGRLIHAKGVDRLLEACAHIGHTQISVAGSGPARDSLSRLASNLRLQIRFVGAVTGVAKAMFLDSCDILVFPSRRYASGRAEGLPVSLLEALVRGRVVIASDGGGVPEVIRHLHNGYLFAAQSDAALRTTLRGVLADWPTASLVSANARPAGRRFTASALAQHHEAAYRSICGAEQKEPA